MANIENRSRYTVTVKNNDALARTFPYSQLEQAKAYHAELRRQGYKPSLGQREDTIAIRIRQKGHRDLNYTARSLDEADRLVQKIEEERSRGLFVDYTKAHQVSFADLIRRYIKEEGPKKKGWEKVEKYKCLGWLEDLDGTLARRDLQRAAEQAAGGRATTARGAMRTPASDLDWMNKPFAEVETLDLERYINDRLEVAAPATVDREVDVLSAICKVAITVWKYRVAENPMTGVRRPRYFNERDRRLKSGEEARLLAAAREEDRLRSIELRTEALMAEARAHAAQLPTVYQRKGHIKVALEACRAQAEQDYVHVALHETLTQFLLMTAARRGEALSLTWDNVDLEGRTAFLPETKNGRSRKLPLRADLVAWLETLGRDSELVFPINDSTLQKAWKRIAARAGLDDLHLHDLRHEGISRVAETRKFSLVDLQAFSGHRDTRMLMRYAHLCTTKLAHSLDEAFSAKGEGQATVVHRGRLRLRSGTGPSISDVLADGPQPAPAAPAPVAAPGAATTNIIPFPGRRALGH
ncbi:site-specific integrase [Cupriavidus lacunae]|uniref:Site-specific integrase n=1 Tax=Cupriavidus lacunae TaxID=2666307 RepID=A0A370NU85_9BURK|nr:site-specific integrase [Cupriavidus lacunae]RDK09165.1 site-specific integrase [Cupriavidus lacunae]